MSRLHYCNSTLWGLPANQLNHLQKTQNASARIVTRTKSREHITSVLRSLHWLPVNKRIKSKIFCLTYQCVHKTPPRYLQELVSQHNPPCSLRSSSLCRLIISGLARTQTINVQGQGHSAMLLPSSGTGCQTSFTEQKTLLHVGGS